MVSQQQTRNWVTNNNVDFYMWYMQMDCLSQMSASNLCWHDETGEPTCLVVLIKIDFPIFIILIGGISNTIIDIINLLY